MTSKEQRRARLKAGLSELKLPQWPKLTNAQVLSAFLRFSLNLMAAIGTGALAVSQAIEPSSFNLIATSVILVFATAIQTLNLRRGRVPDRAALLVPTLYALIMFAASSNHGASAVLALSALILATFGAGRIYRLTATLPVTVMACGQTLQLSETLLPLPLLFVLPYATLIPRLPAPVARYREGAALALSLLSLALQLR